MRRGAAGPPERYARQPPFGPEVTTLYAFLLQAALEDEPAPVEEALSHAVARLVGCKALLDALSRSVGPTPAADRARATLDYDLCLIRLCRQMGIPHRFFKGVSPDSARELAEDDLMNHVPALAGVLARPGSAGLTTSDLEPPSRQARFQPHQENQ